MKKLIRVLSVGVLSVIIIYPERKKFSRRIKKLSRKESEESESNTRAWIG
jgi:hypothetical protein